MSADPIDTPEAEPVTEVTARLRADRSFTVFEDITDATVLGWVDHAATGETTIRFAGTLTADETARVRARMVATDPADEARRAWVAGIDSTDLVNGFDILRALLLGEDPPDPIYPTPTTEEPT